MNSKIINEIAEKNNITRKQVEVVLKLLSEGNTIPFIARYRKEATNNLDEEQIKKINEVYLYEENLLKRKDDVIRLIDEKNLLTEELRKKILDAEKLVDVEDLYRPYKEKKKTKGGEAIKLGLEPLAKIIMSFPTTGSLESISKNFLNDKVKTTNDAITNASYIISEWISDNAAYRKYIRRFIYKEGTISSKLKKSAKDEAKVYEMYYDFTDKVKYIKPYRIMAINRGEKEKVLSVTLDYDKDSISKYLEERIIKNKNSFVVDTVKLAIADSLKRLILPSVEREIRSELKLVAEDESIVNFKGNLESLLMTPPISEKVVLALDPAFRTGCKLAVIDKTGRLLEIAVIYPTEPHNDIENSSKKVLELIDKYNVDIIAIGNGTASRESEKFIADTIKNAKRNVEYIIVSEAGASVYSASPVAIEEFPDLTVEKRSAVSIGRRLQDALAELVKIEPKSIGVGLYQHDVTPKKLNDALTFTVEKVVNMVGVNINTASRSLLSYVSGLNKKAIDEILNHGKFSSREEVKKLKTMTPKIYEQSIGFLRIPEGTNPLDKTGIHPESYDITLKLLESIGLSVNDIGLSNIKEKLDSVNIEDMCKKIETDKYTLEDIIENLKNPNRDPRDNMPKPVLRSDILHIEDLQVWEKLEGTIRNVVDFGLFIDIGLKNDGLAHISKLSTSFIKNPRELFSVGDIVTCYVDEVNLEKKKVSLSLIR